VQTAPVAEITTEAQLPEILGEPLPRVVAKDHPCLERYYGEQYRAGLYRRS
jgi:hypothetical protein